MFSYFKNSNNNNTSQSNQKNNGLQPQGVNQLGNSASSRTTKKQKSKSHANLQQNVIKLPSYIMEQLLLGEERVDNSGSKKQIVNIKLQNMQGQPERLLFQVKAENIVDQKKYIKQNGENKSGFQERQSQQKKGLPNEVKNNRQVKKQILFSNQVKIKNNSPELSQQKSQSPKQNHLASNQLSSTLQRTLTSLLDILLTQLQQQTLQQPLQPSLRHQLIVKTLKPQTLSFITQLNKQNYQKYLIQTKQKYNNLVQQSTNIFGKARKISNLVNQFIMSINLFFQTQDLLIPAQEIQKGIADLNGEKTEKYFNYLIKIFQDNFQQVIEKRVKNVKSTLQKQLRSQQKLKKDLQQQLKCFKQSFKQKQSTFHQQQMKHNQKQSIIQSLRKQIQQLNQKIFSLTSTNKQFTQDYQSQMSLIKRQLQRSKKESQELLQKLKRAEKIVFNKQKVIEERQQEIEKLGEIIKKVKELENQGIDSMVVEMEKKEKMFEQSVGKYSKEILVLEGKVKQIKLQKQEQTKQNNLYKQQISRLKSQIQQFKTKLQTQKLQKHSSISNIQNEQNSINNEQQQSKHNKQTHNKQTLSKSKSHFSKQSLDQEEIDWSKLVNKEILARLFLSFDDQSKEWSIRNNIRNQIYIVLNIKNGQYIGDSTSNKTKGKGKDSNSNKKNQTSNKQQKSSQNSIPPNSQHSSKKQHAVVVNNHGNNSEPSFIGKLFGW